MPMSPIRVAFVYLPIRSSRFLSSLSFFSRLIESGMQIEPSIKAPLPNSEDGEPCERERRYSALLHRYFVNEIRPVRFGPRQDASATALLSTVTILAIHGLFYILAWQHKGHVWRDYKTSNQFLVGVLIYIWILGYDLVSWVIWCQFEKRETYPADDYYVAAGPSVGGEQPVLLEVPSEQLALGLPRR